MELNLKSKITVVTGSTEGIGKAIAVSFAEHGAIVYANGRNREKIEKFESFCREKHIVIPILCGDASDEIFARDSIAEIIKKHERIDILVNNIGKYGNYKNIEELSLEEWNYSININLTSAFLWTREAVPHMKKNNLGKIINISSIAGLSGFVKSAHYNSAKGGMIALTKGLAKELGPFKITVNAIAPGTIETEGLAAEITGDERAQERLKVLARQTPLGRLGKPNDVANTALFLASPLADFITGETIVVSGGFYMN